MVLAASRLEGGSIFMKNGYIIQGPVVDRTEDAVILGWNNGKMTVYRRFIDSLVYDPGEEQQLRELARLRQEEDRVADEFLVEDVVEVGEDELPADVNVLLDMYQAEVASSTPPGTTPSGGGEQPTGDGTAVGPTGDTTPQDPVTPSDTQTTVEVVTPVEKLGERVSHSSARFSLRPPQGWTVSEDESAFQLRGPPQEDGWKPSLNAVLLPREGLTWEECIQLLKEQQSQILERFEVLHEEERKLAADLVGHEVVARGVLGGRDLIVRQVLVPLESDLWLFSGFTPDGPDGELFTVVEESLQSLEFAR